MPTRFPMPYPSSWYAVSASTELRRGQVKRLQYLGRELVAFRGEDGEAHVLDAYCPHLGAHLGVGGKVQGDTVVCPFHGWRFAGDGRCVEAPYARTTPRCSTGSWATVERNGMVWIWYHALGAPPDLEVPALPEHGNPEWTPYRQYRWIVKSHSQEMGENSADSAHFLHVHGTLGVPEVSAEVTPEGVFHAVNRSRNKRFGKVVDTSVDIRIHFPGYSIIRFTELAEVLLLASNTPVDEETVEQVFFFTSRKRGNPLLRALVSQMFMREVARQYEQDMPIWENKIHLPRPVLCDGDGPIWQFRKWFQRFYPARPIGGTTLPVPAAS
ncbi:MAG TPA: Rieske 2Fe-2S domain-containing protein [Myxococcaceae bacterium]|jgi:phenylpropionate dioxygenase-like ring-hydroxylating dioxygenase large terminal subunit